MIYRALTPVANVFGEGTRRPALQVDSVDQIAFRLTTEWIAFPLRHLLTFIALMLVIVVKCQIVSFSQSEVLVWNGKEKNKERKQTNNPLANNHHSLMDIQCLHTDNAIWRKYGILIELLSVFLLCTDFMLQLDRG